MIKNITISIDAEKSLDETQHHIIIKTLNILGVEGMTYFNTTKGMHHKPTVNIILYVENLPLRSGAKQGCLF